MRHQLENSRLSTAAGVYLPQGLTRLEQKGAEAHSYGIFQGCMDLIDRYLACNRVCGPLVVTGKHDHFAYAGRVSWGRISRAPESEQGNRSKRVNTGG